MSLDLIGVSHWYRPDQVLLRNISVQFRAGLSTAIMGPSGSGKTTLLSIAGLLLPARQGTLLFEGQPITRTSQAELAREGMAWLFQATNVLGRRSVADNVGLGALGRGVERGKQEVEIRRALEKVGLGSLGDRKAATLSGGELQRLCLARAMVAQPRVVLADEPTGQLDRTNSDLVASLLVSAFGPETIVVIATHDEAVAALCTRRYRLADGVLQATP